MSKASCLLGSVSLLSATILSACSGSQSLPSASAQQGVSASAIAQSVTRSVNGDDKPLSRDGEFIGHGIDSTATVAVHPSQVGPPVNPLVAGATIPVWYNLTLSGIAGAITAANLAITRFPGGAQVDIYNWQTGEDGPKGTPCAGNANPVSNVD